MIFVTVGTAEKGIEFTRLLMAMDEIAGRLEEEVVMQIGSANVKPKHARSFQYVPFSEALSYFKRASLVVGHGGSGTILNAILFRVPLIVVPRRIQYGEMDKDDHQMELAQRLEEKGLVEVVYDIENLESVVKRMLEKGKEVKKEERSYERDTLIKTLKDFVNSCV